MDLLDIYFESLRNIEEYRNNLSPNDCSSFYDYQLRSKILDEEIEDLYYAINLMRGRIAD